MDVEKEEKEQKEAAQAFHFLAGYATNDSIHCYTISSTVYYTLCRFRLTGDCPDNFSNTSSALEAPTD